MMQEDVIELAARHLWIDEGPQKNRRMLSFRRQSSFVRMQVFLSTGTVLLRTGMYPSRSYRDVHTLERLEDILNMNI